MSERTTIERADIEAAEAVAPLRHNPAIRVLGWMSEAADQPQLISLCVAIAGLGLVTRNRRLARTGARMLAAELIATALKSVVKHRVDRTRPHVPEDGGRYRMEAGRTHESAMNSFPSGHTAGAVAVARALVRDYPEHRAAAVAAATAVAAIQVPRCRHYPTDLAAGAAIGLAAEGLVRAAETGWSRARDRDASDGTRRSTPPELR